MVSVSSSLHIGARADSFIATSELASLASQPQAGSSFSSSLHQVLSVACEAGIAHLLFNTPTTEKRKILFILVYLFIEDHKEYT